MVLGTPPQRLCRGQPAKMRVVQTLAMKARGRKSLGESASKKERFMWHKVRAHPHRPQDLSNVLCGLCWATCKDYCPCGWKLVATHDHAALDEFVQFARAPRNPMLRAWDPEDQRELLDQMRIAWSKGSRRHGDDDNETRGLAALICLGGLTGRASTLAI